MLTSITKLIIIFSTLIVGLIIAIVSLVGMEVLLGVIVGQCWVDDANSELVDTGLCDAWRGPQVTVAILIFFISVFCYFRLLRKNDVL